MVAFAANSVLNRVGVASGGISAESFALVRVISGAVMLAGLVMAFGARLGGRPSLLGVVSLTLYLIGFSRAYLALDAGLGALILFGGVQITMFAGGIFAREAIPPQRWIGMVVAMLGLVWVTGGAIDASGAIVAMLWMGLAAVGWGVYSLVGRGVSDPMVSTAQNFLWSVPIVALWVVPFGVGEITGFGLSMAILSGAVTSGLGYALWYQVLPQLSSSVAAVAQLSVPVIAIIGGAVLLGETVSRATLIGAALVLGGIAVAVLRRPG